MFCFNLIHDQFLVSLTFLNKWNSVEIVLKQERNVIKGNKSQALCAKLMFKALHVCQIFNQNILIDND